MKDSVTVQRARRRAKMGRPPKLTLDVVKQVAEWIGKGMTVVQACAYVGTNFATFESAVVRRPKLRAVYERGKLVFLAGALDVIAAGGRRVQVADGEDDNGEPKFKEVVMPWQGPAWLLERRYKMGGQFARMDMHAIADSQGEPVITLTEDLQKWMQAKAAELYVREKYQPKEIK